MIAQNGSLGGSSHSRSSARDRHSSTGGAVLASPDLTSRDPSEGDLLSASFRRVAGRSSGPKEATNTGVECR